MQLKQHILDLLFKIGLSESEARIYIAAQENPGLQLKDLQKKTGFATATVYRAFDRLKELGLITSSQNQWRRNIQAVSLRTLGEKLAKEQRKLRKVELELKRIDQLSNLATRSFIEEPVQIITDQNQIIDKSFEILNHPWSHLLAFGSGERLVDIFGSEQERQFVNIRCRKGKTADAIMTEIGQYGKELLLTNERFMRNTKINVDPLQQNFMTYIYGDEMTIFHQDKQLGNRAIVITDPVLINMHENTFHNMWSRL